MIHLLKIIAYKYTRGYIVFSTGCCVSVYRSKNKLGMKHTIEDVKSSLIVSLYWPVQVPIITIWEIVTNEPRKKMDVIMNYSTLALWYCLIIL